MSTRLSRSLSAGASESPVYQGKRGQRLSTHASFFSYSYLLFQAEPFGTFLETLHETDLFIFKDTA
ncbi:hypothetical protein MKX08_006312 [Trichoderma sp. CBMAI-0020]|nr:hypothetical protein MKX08_006312 [Trichoderma sp. CBMAI-0020]